jgi:hypothetical protein
MNKTIQLQDLGNKDYKETWEYQEELFKGIVDLKIRNRRRSLATQITFVCGTSSCLYLREKRRFVFYYCLKNNLKKRRHVLQN